MEILDDLDDHWTAKSHKSERNAFVKMLQQLAAEKSVRITILGFVSIISIWFATKLLTAREVGMYIFQV